MRGYYGYGWRGRYRRSRGTGAGCGAIFLLLVCLVLALLLWAIFKPQAGYGYGSHLGGRAQVALVERGAAAFF